MFGTNNGMLNLCTALLRSRTKWWMNIEDGVATETVASKGAVLVVSGISLLLPTQRSHKLDELSCNAWTMDNFTVPGNEHHKLALFVMAGTWHFATKLSLLFKVEETCATGFLCFNLSNLLTPSDWNPLKVVKPSLCLKKITLQQPVELQEIQNSWYRTLDLLLCTKMEMVS